METQADDLSDGPLSRRLQAFIDAQLANPDLKPRKAARALGVSVRSVHGLLRGRPLTFARLVTRRRLQRAQALLVQLPASVAEVAYACGFNSLATFYRQYTAAFGVSPAARRATAGSSPEVLTQRTGGARNEKTDSAHILSMQTSNQGQATERQAAALHTKNRVLSRD